ncbi:MAG: hypothetical protein LBF75_09970 [Treponema sp.]|nr:hypothetical protein [Treponema sp.]
MFNCINRLFEKPYLPDSTVICPETETLESTVKPSWASRVIPMTGRDSYGIQAQEGLPSRSEAPSFPLLDGEHLRCLT